MRARVLALSLLLASCADDDDDPQPEPGAAARFDLVADLASPASFWDFPFPSDLRLDAEGRPETAGYPIFDSPLFTQLRDAAAARPGWPVMPVAYFRFDAPLAPRSLDDVIPARADAPVLLVDVASGELVPTVAQTLGDDRWAPSYLLAVAPRPGMVLRPARTYAVVLRRGLADAGGAPLARPLDFARLARGETPDGPRGAAAATLYAPLFATLADLGVDDAAVATLFTTGDVVAETEALSTGVVARDQASLSPPVLRATHPRFCELATTLRLPQYQTGREPYDDDGHFVLAADGLPVQQGTLDVPAVITIPRTPMPAGGYPLVLYLHGSGGLSAQVVDRGPVLVPDGPETPGEGPAHVVAAHGFAAAGAALPVNPERVPGASDIEYLNLDNPDAFPFLFRQGVIEQRLFLAALAELRIPAEVVAGCLDAGGELRFADDGLFVLGQSMGAMYANMMVAVEPRVRAVVPTGAGGFWPFMLGHSLLFADLIALLPSVVNTDQELSFVHPALFLLELAWEPADPFVYMPRIGRRPLPGFAPRPIFEPVGLGDTYFGTPVFDAAALAYGHPQAGDMVWPGMQDALALVGLDGVVDYPVSGNLRAEDGTPYTGVIVQYQGDGLNNPHSIFSQLPAVKRQYVCFLESVWQGEPTVVDPGPPRDDGSDALPCDPL